MVVELVLSVDEEDEQEGEDAEEKLEDPGAEGHVDVENIALFSLAEDVRVNDIGDAVGVLYNVAESKRVQKHLRNA